LNIVSVRRAEDSSALYSISSGDDRCYEEGGDELKVQEMVNDCRRLIRCVNNFKK